MSCDPETLVKDSWTKEVMMASYSPSVGWLVAQELCLTGAMYPSHLLSFELKWEILRQRPLGQGVSVEWQSLGPIRLWVYMFLLLRA